MKTLLAFLAIASAALASEKIVVVTTDEIPKVQAMLDDGWTVKAQSSTPTNGGGKYRRSVDSIHVFTLAEPSPEKQAEAAKKKAEAFAKRRAEYLAKTPKVEQ